MIRIIDKKDCVGCNGCIQCCPKQCILFKEDEQGFLYPEVNISECINCGLCERVCPVINQGIKQNPLAVYAAYCSDKQILKSSSSGGIFSALAIRVLKQGGIVFGARFDDNWMVTHDSVESVEELHILRGAKYVQSQIGACYKQVERHLKSDRLVMFTGTPCQIAGLRLFLRKEYDNLLLVEVVCHGVPSPKIWKDYLNSIANSACTTKFNSTHNATERISKIAFRDKRNGWEKYGMVIVKSGEENSERFESIRDNIYMQAFLRDLDLRPSCYECPSKCGKSHSDIILGDFWKVSQLEPQAYCPAGTSLVLINTPKGEQAISDTNVILSESTYRNAIASNESLINSALKPKLYSYFWRKYHEHGISSLPDTIKRARGSILKRIIKVIHRKLELLLK